ncbi:MAG TPA: NAD+ synthase [Candidatus Anoxymicrobiaceae bacterium]
MSELLVALAQINTAVGDLDGNARKILEYVDRAIKARADIVVFPEMCLTGYPPEDLLLKSEFTSSSMEAARCLAEGVGDIVAVVGFVESASDTFNSAAVMSRGEMRCTYRKTFLPNYGVFDEKRYFGVGAGSVILEIDGVRLGVTICEDIWFPGGPVEEQVAGGGAEMILNLSASPFNRGKFGFRRKLIEARSMDGPVVIAYVNTVGAQDELVFDGGSCVYHPQLGYVAQAGRFTEELLLSRVSLGPLKSARMLEPRFRYSQESPHSIEVCALQRPGANDGGPPDLPVPEPPHEMSLVEEIFEALVLGLREYVAKNGFSKVVLGLSGGIDSAVTAALAVEALGGENVVSVFLPSKYTSSESGSAAKELADNLEMKLITLPIGDIYSAYKETLAGEVTEAEKGETFENVQARIRGNLLMALSNRFGWLVLATGNKSELSMGYCTLYGDMAGGFAVIKDLLKTQVYQVAEYINVRAGTDVIPRSVIDRPPTAELRENQLDTDTLPPYEQLDPVLEAYVEEALSLDEIIGRGFSQKLVRSIVARVDANEYKRRQAPVGVKITPRAFGRDWRMPISTHRRGASSL